MARSVPYFDVRRQLAEIRDELDRALASVLDTGQFVLGPAVAEFEQAFASYLGVKYCVGLNSGTSALHLALRVLDVGPGAEVITTPFTFVATAWAIEYVGARPVFVDVEPDTLNIDPAALEAAIGPRTRAVIVVHLYGHPCEINRIMEICNTHGIALVEDAAQAHGAMYQGRAVGTFGAVSCFSFYPTKNLGACGEGGALVTNDERLAVRARALRDHGSTRKYYHDELGYNYRMEAIQGAVLHAKLKHLDRWNAERARAAARYLSRLRNLPLQLPVERPGCKSAWHLFTLRTPERDRLREFLQAHGIGTAVHYPAPLHLQKAFKHLGYEHGAFPQAERAAAECLSLPLYPGLTDEELDYVIENIQCFFGAHGR